jgi:hypothetical protein
MMSQQRPTMPRPQRPRLQDTSIGRKVNLGLWFADILALSVHVFMRRKIGYRVVEPVTIIVLFLFMFLGAGVFLIPFGWITGIHIVFVPAEQVAFAIFGLAMLGLGLFHRLRHWQHIKSAEKHQTTWMTTSRGVSHFEFLPIPQHIVYRFVDAGVCFAFGWLISGQEWLGYWLMISALCFMLVENQSYNVQLNYTLDMLDNMIAARAQARLVQFYSPESQEIRLSRSETAGLPTGVARDVERLISERYATAAAAGNLAPSAAGLTPEELSVQAAERATFRPGTPPPDNLVRPGSD